MVPACACCQAPASVFCHNDNAHLCAGCDESVHSTSVVAQRHTRVALCGQCAQPSTVYCHNDSAFFCSGCNDSVHLANPLACKHTMSPASEVAARTGAAPVPAPEASDSAVAVVPVLEHHSATSSPAAPVPRIPPAVELPPLTKPVSMNELKALWGGDELKVRAARARGPARSARGE
jgi:hypothetical protein